MACQGRHLVYLPTAVGGCETLDHVLVDDLQRLQPVLAQQRGELGQVGVRHCMARRTRAIRG
jgi:hypothetical protein